MATYRLLPSLPRIKVQILHQPQRLKTAAIPSPRGHMELLRKMLNRVVREERCEFKHNRAFECRAYVERLIQLAVFRGSDDPYTREMFDWWFVEQDLLEKMYNTLVPRYADYPIDEPYTSLYRLPTLRLKSWVNKDKVFWNQYSIGVLELKGNPFPPMDELEERRKRNLLNYAKKELTEKRI